MQVTAYWEYIWRNTLLGLRYRHAGSLLGPAWFIVDPVVQVAIYSLVFTGIMEHRIPTGSGGSLNFTVYLCAGLMPWTAFSELIGRAPQLLTRNASLILNTALPETVIFLRDAAEGLIVSLITISIVVALALILGHQSSAAWFLLPLVLTVFMTFGLGIALVVGTLSVFIRDIGPALTLTLRVAFWATPIVYVPSVLPDNLQGLIRFNPVYPFTSAIQRAILYGQAPDSDSWLTMTAVAAGAIALGLTMLFSLRSSLRDGL